MAQVSSIDVGYCNKKKKKKKHPNDRFSAFDSSQSFVIDSPLQNFVHYKQN